MKPLLLFCFLCLAFTGHAQEQENYHDPRKATLLAMIPGAGQIYNKKYWKLPIVYGGLGASIYSIQTNSQQYNLYRDAYLIRVDENPNTVDQFDPNNPTPGNPTYTDANLLTLIDFYQGNRDLSVIALVGVYVLQILDANVDAHLYEFDVSDDLSMNWTPAPITIPGTNYQTGGIALRLNF